MLLQYGSLSLDPGLVEGVRDAQESPCTVPGVVVSRAGSPVRHPPAELLSALHHGVGCPAINVNNEPHSTGILLQAWVIQTLSRGVTPTTPVIGHPAWLASSSCLYQ